MSSGIPYTYSWTATEPARGRITTSRQEVLQISVAFAVLTLDFVLILFVGGVFTGSSVSSIVAVPLDLVGFAALVALTAFVCHELAHKISAQRHGYWAEFRWSPIGLAFSVVTAYLGLLFAAPGATVIGGMGNVRDWGRTSLAGPLTNLSFAAAFYAGATAAWFFASPLYFWLLLLAWFNSFFGVFNLLPFGPLDGAKVLRWSSAIWVVAFVVGVAAAVVSYLAVVVVGRPVL
ncbi:MAG TPA: site-2 protease family protein [Thermoplasmata archaeon]|nr:site-2 protease family protein [Thermoplasmata archaeon]